MRLPNLAAPILREHDPRSVIHPRGIHPQSITFAQDWDDPNNSNAGAYTQLGATNVLRNYSNDLAKAIDSPACNIQVVKGCHQPGPQQHFTLNENGGRKNCKSLYAGTKSVHVPC